MSKLSPITAVFLVKSALKKIESSNEKHGSGIPILRALAPVAGSPGIYHRDSALLAIPGNAVIAWEALQGREGEASWISRHRGRQRLLSNVLLKASAFKIKSPRLATRNILGNSTGFK